MGYAVDAKSESGNDCDRKSGESGYELLAGIFSIRSAFSRADDTEKFVRGRGILAFDIESRGGIIDLAEERREILRINLPQLRALRSLRHHANSLTNFHAAAWGYLNF